MRGSCVGWWLSWSRAASATIALGSYRYESRGPTGYHAAAGAKHKDVDGRTPLLHATDSLKGPEFVTLLREKSANVHSTGKRGMTPLFWATDKKVDTDVAKVLIQHGADVNARDADGRTPLSLACSETGNPRTAELLREMGARME